MGAMPLLLLLRRSKWRDRENVDDETLIKADIAEKAIRQLEELIAELTADKIGEEKAKELAATPTSGK